MEENKKKYFSRKTENIEMHPGEQLTRKNNENMMERN